MDDGGRSSKGEGLVQRQGQPAAGDPGTLIPGREGSKAGTRKHER
jgi:hypothetical protein